jgi:hypothetical protein
MFIENKIIFKAAALFALVFVLSGCGPPPPCTVAFLIYSINNANNNGPGMDTINLDPGCVYELGVVDNTIDGNNGLPSITSSIVINGNDATIRRSTGAQKSAIRLFHISQGGDLVLNNVTLLDGMAIEPTDVTDPIRNSGGAIFNNGGLTINNSLITANRAKLRGGGIYNAGSMTINATTIQNNEVNIGNEPNESGGGIRNTGTATINDSTIANNIASQSAGGIGNSGSLTITNSTISGNSTTLAEIVSGAAIINSGYATISYTTIANNVGTTSGAVFSVLDTIQISNSIIADNISGDCSYPATSPISGPNLDSDGTCTGFTITDNPQLGPLANNGGPTQTHSIAASSPAKNAAAGSCPAADQRGEPRPHGSACDLGAYEFSGGGGPPGDSSFISGLVFDDSNADGILDPGEPGFAGVELVLESGPCLAPVSAISELTASDGTYQFEVLPPTAGTYCMSVDPTTPPNLTILIPGGFITPPGGEIELVLTEGEDLMDLNFAWDFQFAGSDLAPNPVITNVVLSTTSPPDGGWVGVEVTVENQGAYPAEDYELVLIPHYGWGPPNPAGYVALPDLMPGVPHTEVFSPGVLYSPAGTYTLRVLVTDDWYALGDPDSTGTNGDYQDFTITVMETFSKCFPFYDMELSLVLLKIRPDTLSLPVYLKTEGEPIPEDPEEFYAIVGDYKSNPCSFQGFDDRLYCMLTITPDMPGTVVDFFLYRDECKEPAFTLLNLTIPELPPGDDNSTPNCTEDLEEDACKAAGGTMSTGATRAPYCICP